MKLFAVIDGKMSKIYTLQYMLRGILRNSNSYCNALALPAGCLASAITAESVEATTAITLPVDSVTIYPDGLMAVKRTGSLDVTEGVHKFVINVPEKAEQSSVLLSVSNATQERVVYDANPVYTLNISAPGSQSFDLSYLMYNAATWKPVYDLHLLSDSVLVKANAVLSNRAERISRTCGSSWWRACLWPWSPIWPKPRPR